MYVCNSTWSEQSRIPRKLQYLYDHLLKAHCGNKATTLLLFINGVCRTSVVFKWFSMQ